MTDAEDRLRAALEQTEEWELASGAAEGLRDALVEVGPRTYEGPADRAGSALRLYAYLIMGVRIFRTVRAAMAVLSIGYESEARAHDRVLVELTAHRDALRKDQSGKEGHAWLNGERDRGISKKVSAMGPKDLYANLSRDPRAVWPLYEAQSGSIVMGPQRKPFAARASLLMYAGLCTDQIKLIAAGAQNLEVEGLDEAVERIRAANKRLGDEADVAGIH